MIPTNKRCEIYRPYKTADGSGGSTTAYRAMTTVPCRKSGATGKDLQWAGARQQAIDAVLYVNPGVDIQEDDKIVIEGQSFIASPMSDPSISAYGKYALVSVRR